MNNQNPFGEIIYAYTRAQAVADGYQVDVTKTAQEAGIKFPMFLTRAVMTITLQCRKASPARMKPDAFGMLSG